LSDSLLALRDLRDLAAMLSRKKGREIEECIPPEFVMASPHFLGGGIFRKLYDIS